MFPCAISKKRVWLYVALSRVKKIENLFILDWNKEIEDWLISAALLSEDTKKFENLINSLIDLSNPFE